MFAIGRHVSRLSGYAPALPTPFYEAGTVDGNAFARLCDRQIRHGATALVACRTTGEAPTLTPAEHDRIVRIVVDVAQGRVPVIAGAVGRSDRTAYVRAVSRDQSGSAQIRTQPARAHVAQGSLAPG